MNGYLISVTVASFLVSVTLVADIQDSKWNLILNLDFHIRSSTLLDVLDVVEAGGCTSKNSSLSVLEMNLNFVICHTFKHLFAQFEETE